MEIDEQTAEELKKQILVVEDESLIAADIQGRLQRMGYAVPVVADSGEEALRCARSKAFDLVLMDIRLSGEMDGIAAAQALRNDCQTPVVYITAHADPKTIQRAKLTEPFGYVVKPIADGDLHSAVEIATYKHEMERRMRASEAWLSSALRSIGEGVVATNTAAEIVFMNPAAEKLTGWTAGEARGRQLVEILRLQEESTGRPADNPALEYFGGLPQAYKLISRAGDKMPVEIECFASGGPVPGSIVVVRNITARREVEARLTQSERMEAVANLAAGLAHDFNSQLALISRCADDLSARLSDSDRQPAAEIQRSVAIASSITRQLLTLSRRDAVQSELLNLDEVIAELHPMICRSLGSAASLETDLGAAAESVCYDRNQLHQVLVHLAAHARNAMPAGGQWRIESRIVEIATDSPLARLYRPGRYVRLRLTDSGAGLDDEDLAHIFEPFFAAGLGTNLGLSIAHSIITGSGGYITATSEAGRGTTFEILSPCVSTPQTPGDRAQMYDLMRALEAEQRVTRQALDNLVYEKPAGEPTATVLLVDDEDAVRRLMVHHLGREGYRVLEARNAAEAERIAETHEGPIQILITDVMMPDKKGPVLAEAVERVRPDIKVLFVSGAAPADLAAKGVRKRNATVLRKPFTVSQLLECVQLLLKQKNLAPS